MADQQPKLMISVNDEAAAAELSAELERQGLPKAAVDVEHDFIGVATVFITVVIPMTSALAPVMVEVVRGWMNRNKVESAQINGTDGNMLLRIEGATPDQIDQIAGTLQKLTGATGTGSPGPGDGEVS